MFKKLKELGERSEKKELGERSEKKELGERSEKSGSTKARTYPVLDTNSTTASPAYTERDTEGCVSLQQQRAALSKTTSSSGCSPGEISSRNFLHDVIISGQGEEDLPPYQEPQPTTMIMQSSGSTLSSVSSSRGQPRTMCPCARCFRQSHQ